MHSSTAAVPTLPGLPVVGNWIEFRRDRLGLHGKVAALGPIARFHLGPLPVYVITDAELAHQVLVDEADAFTKDRAITRFLRHGLGDGLLTSEGETHRRHRKLLSPAFSPRRVAAYGGTMVAETLAQMGRWADGAAVDVAHEMMQMTLAIAGKTLFGSDVRADSDAVERGMTMAMEALVAAVTSPIPFALPMSWPLLRNLKSRRANAMLDRVVYRLIREARRANVDRGDVMSMLLLARDDSDGQGLSDQAVRDEVLTLLLAGHETTANALSWTWYQLGRNPGVLRALQHEVDQVLAGRSPTVEDLECLPWTLQVLEESMRLHPPAYMTGREAIHDVHIGGHLLVAGTTVLINIRGIHRRADYFPAPLVFDPARMSAAEKKARPKGRYLPFGAGPRVCIGSHFAMMEAHLALSTMAQVMEFEAISAGEVVPEPMITLRPRGGMPMRVRRRERSSEKTRGLG